jgi:transcriptional regulator with XRE-family HTH domain
MTPVEARAILARHQWTQLQVAQGMGVSLRSAQRWFTEVEEVPPPVAVLLRTWDSLAATRPTVQTPPTVDTADNSALEEYWLTPPL